MIFISCDQWKTLIFQKACNYSEIFFNRHIVVFFETSVLKEVRILHYLNNNNTGLIPKFQNVTIVYHTYTG